jgi:hypothetical protein
MGIKRFSRRVLLAIALLGTTMTAGLAATAGPASANLPPEEYVAILPTGDQARDLANGGVSLPVIARDSSGISFAETWIVTYTAFFPGQVYLANRYTADGSMYLKGGGPAGSAATASAYVTAEDVKYRWTIEGDRFNATLRNVATGLVITYHAPGTQGPGKPTYTMEAKFQASGQQFKINKLA